LPVRSMPLIPPPVARLDTVPSSPAAAGIGGKITDQVGGGIAGAEVRLRRLTSPAIRDVKADASGEFNVAGLEPGRYELQVSATGFQQMRKQIDVQPSQVARADSTLTVGSVSETVAVEAGAVLVNTETASLARRTVVARPLPSKLPAESTVVNGKVTLATDSNGALFRSTDGGRTWKVVKPAWQGKVDELVRIDEPGSASGAAFQLKTDNGTTWLSRDGSKWHLAPAR